MVLTSSLGELMEATCCSIDECVKHATQVHRRKPCYIYI